MSGNANHFCRAHDLPCLPHAEIVLSQVHTVRVGGDRQIRSIVDDETGFGCASQYYDGSASLDQLPVRHFLVALFDETDVGIEQLLYQFG